ncbi:hypothetical protein [Solitalea koreensis]|uniref:ThiF family protein n=1 Tax=Solitalea koreensis TaxID=543615 RepID=A0A521AZ75_9SPHI|nr:hypothetical protein [Solitalea koreensis]SMO40061.1 hypothetical protein SAMN06265350_101532 [Solitalea koreensis]
MIVIVGGAGLAGSNLVLKLNTENFNDIVIADDYTDLEKKQHLLSKRFSKKIKYQELPRFLTVNQLHVQLVVVTEEVSTELAKGIWNSCLAFGLPLLVLEKGIQSTFEEISKAESRKPYFWSIVKTENIQQVALATESLFFLMKERRSSGVYEIDTNGNCLALQNIGFQSLKME